MSEVQNNEVQPTENKVYAITNSITGKHLGWAVARSLSEARVLTAKNHPECRDDYHNYVDDDDPTIELLFDKDIAVCLSDGDPEKIIAEEHHVITLDGFFAVPVKDFHIWGEPRRGSIYYDKPDGSAAEYSTDKDLYTEIRLSYSLYGAACIIGCSDGTLLRYDIDDEGVGRFEVLRLGTAYKDTTLYGGAVSEQVRFKPAPAWVVVGDALIL